MKKFLKQLVILIIILICVAGIVLAENDIWNDIRIDYQHNLDLFISVDEIELEYNSLYLPDFNVRGIYVTGWTAGMSDRMKRLISLVDNSELNAMVIDVKDGQGYLSYKTEVKLAKKLKANRNKIKDIKGLLDLLHKKGIYTIARIVVFKDALLASNRRDFALSFWLPEEKKITYSSKWVDPGKEEVWNYNINIAREALELGFDEVQFDYIRFPALGQDPTKVVLNDGMQKSELINKFAVAATKKLSDLSKPISIDVFGLTTASNDDLGIGQNFNELTDIINIISPMIYPSHYAPGSYGIPIPAKEPYKIIYNSINDAREKVYGREEVIIRPWLQDFSLKHKYTVQDIEEQIKAVEDLGIKEWLLWNPRSKYTEEVFLKPPT